MGEELGWRGFLLRKLLPLGQWPALLISGVIWGIWHLPLVLMGQNYPTLPVAGPFLMIGFTVLMGIILGWLQLASRSVWVPALAHGTLNAVNGLPLLFLTGVDRSVGGPPSSIIGWLGIGACVLCFDQNEYFDGLIDDVRIYDMPLSVGEIGELYSGGP